MTHAICIEHAGGPEVLRWQSIEVGQPGSGEIRIRQTAVGLNYIDTYYRNGSYPIQPFAIPGLEAAGVIEAVGSGVEGLLVGQRVAYASAPMGAYAEARLMPAERVLRIPDGISDGQAASMMLKGMTAAYLLHRTYRVKPGDTILVHAAAGGVGLILCQWARQLGATVIGTVGDEHKAALARAHGCHHVILYREENFVARVAELTGGKKCDVVYDGVGLDTFNRSLDCIKPFGLMVLYGAASGPVPPFDLAVLAAKGSLFVTRPSVSTYVAERADLSAIAAMLFDAVLEGVVKMEVHQTYALRDAAQAHRELEGRKTVGSSILLV